MSYGAFPLQLTHFPLMQKLQLYEKSILKVIGFYSYKEGVKRSHLAEMSFRLGNIYMKL